MRLLEKGEHTAAQLARELGARRNQLYKWQDELAKPGESAFSGKGRRSGAASESLVLRIAFERMIVLQE